MPIVTDFVLAVTHETVIVAVPDAHCASVTVAGTVNDVMVGLLAR